MRWGQGDTVTGSLSCPWWPLDGSFQPDFRVVGGPLVGTGDPEASPPSRTSHMASCQPHHPRLNFNQQQLGFQDCGLQIFGTMKRGEKCGESS